MNPVCMSEDGVSFRPDRAGRVGRTPSVGEGVRSCHHIIREQGFFIGDVSRPFGVTHGVKGVFLELLVFFPSDM